MEEGFGLDHGNSDMARALGWHPGAPDKRWYGLKINKKSVLPMVMMRCNRCGFVEAYAG